MTACQSTASLKLQLLPEWPESPDPDRTRCIFQAGFVWRVVNQKWEDFEDVFFGFPPDNIVMLSPEQLDRIAQNPRIIRNRQKALTIQSNAQFILDVSQQFSSFRSFVSQWPSNDLMALIAQRKKRGTRLGGMSGPRVLRNMGKRKPVVTTATSAAFALVPCSRVIRRD